MDFATLGLNSSVSVSPERSVSARKKADLKRPPARRASAQKSVEASGEEEDDEEADDAMAAAFMAGHRALMGQDGMAAALAAAAMGRPHDGIAAALAAAHHVLMGPPAQRVPMTRRMVDFSYYFMSETTPPESIGDVVAASGGRGMAYVLYRLATWLFGGTIRCAVLPSVVSIQDALAASSMRDSSGTVAYPSAADLAGNLKAFISARTMPLGLAENRQAADGSYIVIMTVSGGLPPSLASLNVEQAKRAMATEAILEFPTTAKRLTNSAYHVHYTLWCNRLKRQPVMEGGGRGRGGGGRGRGRRGGSEPLPGADVVALAPNEDKLYSRYMYEAAESVTKPQFAGSRQRTTLTALEDLGAIPSLPILSACGTGFITNKETQRALQAHYSNPEELVRATGEVLENPEFLLNTDRIIRGLRDIVALSPADADPTSYDQRRYDGKTIRVYRRDLLDAIAPAHPMVAGIIMDTVAPMLTCNWQPDSSFLAHVGRKVLPSVSLPTASVKKLAAMAEERFERLLARPGVLRMFGWRATADAAAAGGAAWQDAIAAMGDYGTAIKEAEAATRGKKICNDITAFNPADKDSETRIYVSRLVDYIIGPVRSIQMRVLHKIACLLCIEIAALESLGLVSAIQRRVAVVRGYKLDDDDNDDDGAGADLARPAAVAAAAAPPQPEKLTVKAIGKMLLDIMSDLAAARHSAIALLYSELMCAGTRANHTDPNGTSCLGILEKVRATSHRTPEVQFIPPAHVRQNVGAFLRHVIIFVAAHNGEQKKVQFVFMYDNITAMMFSSSQAQQAVRIPVWASSGGDGKTFTVTVLDILMAFGLEVDYRMTGAARARTAVFGHLRISSEGGVSLVDGTGTLSAVDEVLKAILMDNGGSHTTVDKRADGTMGPVTIRIETGASGFMSVSNNLITAGNQQKSYADRRIRQQATTERDVFGVEGKDSPECTAATSAMQRVLYVSRMVGILAAAMPVGEMPAMILVQEVFSILFGTEGGWKQLPFCKFDARKRGHYSASARSRMVQAAALMACGGPDRRVTPDVLADVTLGAAQLPSLIMATVAEACQEACYSGLLTFVQTLAQHMCVRASQQQSGGAATHGQQQQPGNSIVPATTYGSRNSGASDERGNVDMRLGDGLDVHAYFRSSSLVVAVMRQFATFVERVRVIGFLASMKIIEDVFNQAIQRNDGVLEPGQIETCSLEFMKLRQVDERIFSKEMGARGCPLSRSSTVEYHTLQKFYQEIYRPAAMEDLFERHQDIVAGYCAYLDELDKTLAERYRERDVQVHAFATHQDPFLPAGFMLPPFRLDMLNDYLNKDIAAGVPARSDASAQPMAPPPVPMEIAAAAEDEDDGEMINSSDLSWAVQGGQPNIPPPAAMAQPMEIGPAVAAAPRLPVLSMDHAGLLIQHKQTAAAVVESMAYTADDRSEATMWDGRTRVPAESQRLLCRIGVLRDVTTEIHRTEATYGGIYNAPFNSTVGVSELTGQNFLRLAMENLESPTNKIPLTDESKVRICHVDKVTVVVLSNMLATMARMTMPSVELAMEATPPVQPLFYAEVVSESLRDAFRHLLAISYPSAKSKEAKDPALLEALRVLDERNLSCSMAIRTTLKALCTPPTRNRRNCSMLLYVRQQVLVFLATFGDEDLHKLSNEVKYTDIFNTPGFSRIANDRPASPDYYLSGLRDTRTLLAVPGMVPIPPKGGLTAQPPIYIAQSMQLSSGVITPVELYVNVATLAHIWKMRAAMEAQVWQQAGCAQSAATYFSSLPSAASTHANPTVGQYVRDPYSPEDDQVANELDMMAAGDDSGSGSDHGEAAATGFELRRAHSSVTNAAASRNIATNIGVVAAGSNAEQAYGWTALPGMAAEAPLTYATVRQQYPVDVLEAIRVVGRFPQEACPSNIPKAMMGSHSKIERLMELSGAAAPTAVLDELLHELEGSLAEEVHRELAASQLRPSSRHLRREREALLCLRNGLAVVLSQAVEGAKLLDRFVQQINKPAHLSILVGDICKLVAGDTDLTKIIVWFYNKNYSMRGLCGLLRQVLVDIRAKEKREVGQLPPGRTAIFLCIATVMFHLPRGIAVDCIHILRGARFIDDPVLSAYDMVENKLRSEVSHENLHKHVSGIRETSLVPDDVFVEAVFSNPLHCNTIDNMFGVVSAAADRCRFPQQQQHNSARARAGGGFDTSNPSFQAAVVVVCYEIVRALCLSPAIVSTFCNQTFKREAICPPNAYTADPAAQAAMEELDGNAIRVADEHKWRKAGYASVEDLYMEHYTAAHSGDCVEVMCSNDALRLELQPPHGSMAPAAGTNRSFMAGWDALGPIIGSWFVVRDMHAQHVGAAPQEVDARQPQQPQQSRRKNKSLPSQGNSRPGSKFKYHPVAWSGY